MKEQREWVKKKGMGEWIKFPIPLSFLDLYFNHVEVNISFQNSSPLSTVVRIQ